MYSTIGSILIPARLLAMPVPCNLWKDTATIC
jgi:hypothetical protein